MATIAAARVELVSFGSSRFQSLEVGGLLVTSAVFPSRERLHPHLHDRTCVAATLHGGFDSRMLGRSHWSRPSMLLTEPAGERHDNLFGPAGARVLVVQPDGRRVELLQPFARFLDSINHFCDVRVGQIAGRLRLEIERPDAVTPLAVEALGLELLATAARWFGSRQAFGAPPSWLVRVRDCLHDAFADGHRLADLAAVAGVHPGHLTRMFRRYYGCSVGAYQRGVRLDWAARELVARGDPLVRIAASAGFADQSHFTRAFRKRFGCTPGEYRARARSAGYGRT